MFVCLRWKRGLMFLFVSNLDPFCCIGLWLAWNDDAYYHSELTEHEVSEAIRLHEEINDISREGASWKGVRWIGSSILYTFEGDDSYSELVVTGMVTSPSSSELDDGGDVGIVSKRKRGDVRYSTVLKGVQWGFARPGSHLKFSPEKLKSTLFAYEWYRGLNELIVSDYYSQCMDMEDSMSIGSLMDLFAASDLEGASELQAISQQSKEWWSAARSVIARCRLSNADQIESWPGNIETIDAISRQAELQIIDLLRQLSLESEYVVSSRGYNESKKIMYGTRDMKTRSLTFGMVSRGNEKTERVSAPSVAAHNSNRLMQQLQNSLNILALLHYPPERRYSSVYTNISNKHALHADTGNVGPSGIYAFGAFEGGDLWLAGEDCCAQCRGEGKHEVTKGCCRFHDIRHKMLNFHGKCKHMNTAFTGSVRLSSVFYVNINTHQISNANREILLRAGFNLPSPEEFEILKKEDIEKEDHFNNVNFFAQKFIEADMFARQERGDLVCGGCE